MTIAIRARAGVVRQIRVTLGIDEGVAADSGNDADSNAQATP